MQEGGDGRRGGREHTFGINPRITRPIAALSTLITTRLANAPPNTVMRACRVAIMAAMRKVLSPISDTTIMMNAWKRASGNCQLSCLALVL